MLSSTPIAVVAVLVAVLVPGVPLALVTLRRLRPGTSVVLVVAAGLGLVTWLVVGIPAVHHGWFQRRSMVGAVAVVSALAWIPARAQVRLLRPRRPSWLAGVLAALTVPALALRDDPIYFAYQVADFGEYVNRGNVIADGGRFGGFFVNGFPLLMAESHLLFGEAGTVRIMPFIGLLAAALVLAVASLLGAGRLPIAALAVVMAFQVHWVWFAQFPASETLYAALLVLAVVLAVVGLQGRDHVPAAAAGIVGFLLVLTRGNGLVLLPVIAIAIAGLVAFVDRDQVAHARSHLLALASGIWLGSLYDSRFNAKYFLDAQAAPRLPDPVSDLFVRLDEPLIAAGFTVFVGLALGAAVAIGTAFERLRRAPATLEWVRRAAMGAVVVIVAGAHLFVISERAYRPRYAALGIVVVVAVGLALVVWAWGRIADGAVRFALGWPLLVALVMATFQAGRLKKSITVDAPWFLYWDRYYFSEVFPMALVASAAAAVVVAGWLRAAPTGARRAVGVGALVVGVLVVVDIAPPTAQASEQAMFAGTYEELSELDRIMAEPIPIVYDGLAAFPEGWFWSNSSRVLANPLVETFDRRVLNPAGATNRDPRPTTAEIVELLVEVGVEDAFVLQVSHEPAWPSIDAEILGVSVVAEEMIRIERLDGRSARPPEEQRWIPTVLHVRILRVAVPAAT